MLPTDIAPTCLARADRNLSALVFTWNFLGIQECSRCWLHSKSKHLPCQRESCEMSKCASHLYWSAKKNDFWRCCWSFGQSLLPGHFSKTWAKIVWWWWSVSGTGHAACGFLCLRSLLDFGMARPWLRWGALLPFFGFLTSHPHLHVHTWLANCRHKSASYIDMYKWQCEQKIVWGLIVAVGSRKFRQAAMLPHPLLGCPRFVFGHLRKNCQPATSKLM